MTTSRKQFVKLPFGFLTSYFQTQHSPGWLVIMTGLKMIEQLWKYLLTINFIQYFQFESFSKQVFFKVLPPGLFAIFDYSLFLGNLIRFHDFSNHFHMGNYLQPHISNKLPHSSTWNPASTRDSKLKSSSFSKSFLPFFPIFFSKFLRFYYPST